ncbi:phosphoglycolate phosphatase [Ameyamaea chiangmaiensis NBRC 103196]|uniref:HAD hydrolase-like protein n=1 Tax=Ameyamaea chiangmaiensis TaxID=442969 RepID=UPI001FE57EAB|nr:HAD hydrolase-like protein [Ameyamaea chiangmaiensis]GBQ68484.1 phosphoglycolate phosphatase [Ameyamaea chiangmaiensis NBRC 103196]
MNDVLSDTGPSALPHGSAILLDLDGTIIDSRHGIISTIHDVLRDMGHEPDLSQDLTWVVGPPLHDLIGEILHRYGDDRVEDAVRRYRALYESRGMHHSPVYDGMRDVIAGFAASPARLFLATSKPVHLARAILGLRELDGYFTQLHGARPDDSGAEKPELIAELLRQHRIAPEHAVMVGDRRFDISGAHANRVRAIGVLWGYGGADELTEAGADQLAAAPADLPGLVAEQLAAARRHDHADSRVS